MTDYAKDSLVKLPLTGGAPVRLAAAEMAFHGEWGRDGFIYWSNALISGIVRTPADGGDTEAVTTVNMDAQERNHRFARLLPDSKAVMFTVASADIETYDDGRIDVVELATKNRKTLIKGGTYARYSPSGHVVYTRGGSLYAVPFDARCPGRSRYAGEGARRRAHEHEHRFCAVRHFAERGSGLRGRSGRRRPSHGALGGSPRERVGAIAAACAFLSEPAHLTRWQVSGGGDRRSEPRSLYLRLPARGPVADQQ